MSIAGPIAVPVSNANGNRAMQDHEKFIETWFGDGAEGRILTQINRVKKQTYQTASFAIGTYTMIGNKKIQADFSIPTAATDGVEFLYNPSVVIEWHDLELRFVILHEGEHINKGHHLRRPEWCHPILWNIATDYSINGDLMRSANYGKDFIAPPDVLYDDFYSTCEWSCEKIARDILGKGWQPPEEEEGDFPGPQPPGEDGDQEEGDEQGGQGGGEQGQGEKKENTSGHKGTSCGEIRDAPVRQNGTPQEVEEARRELKERVAQAKIIEKSHGMGDGDGRFTVSDETSDEHFVPSQIVREFLQGSFEAERSFRRPNKRFYALGHTLPTRRTEPAELIVCIDSSGSVGYEEFTAFKTELVNWAHDLEVKRIKVAYVDRRIHKNPDSEEAWFVYDLDTGSGADALDLDIWGGGGTSFDPIFKYIEENNDDVQALIYMTDGEGRVTHDEPPFPVLWVTSHVEPRFFNQAQWGEIVYI